jgi:type IV pilus assembly protein PilM
MQLLDGIKRVVKDPPPEFAFEISSEGLAWAETARPSETHLHKFPDGILSVNPVKPNFSDAAALTQALRECLPPPPGRPATRLAVLVLPDYCSRTTVLDFDSFPPAVEEQVALARFRVKRTVPFEIEDALIACYPQPRKNGSKGLDVVTVAIGREIASQYTVPFHNAGFQCGLITLSGLAALSLDDANPDAPAQWIQVKLAGRVLTVCLVDRGALRMFRSVELDHATVGEMVEILAPTLAYAEDELGERPSSLRLCGFGTDDEAGEKLGAELNLTVQSVLSPLGTLGASNAGLLGMLATTEVR